MQKPSVSASSDPAPVYLPALCPLDPSRAEPLPVQIFLALHAAMRAGRLRGDMTLPSSREAARSLGLSRSTLTSAYELLRAEGLLDIRPGKRPKLCLPVIRPASQEGHEPPTVSCRGRAAIQDLRAASYRVTQGRLAPGMPDPDLFPADLWARLLRRHARQDHGDSAGYGSYHGSATLRDAIAVRLRSDRGLTVSPEQILITPGTQASLTLITQLMTDSGMTVAMETPGYLGARAAFLSAGARIVPVPVDEDGFRVDALPGTARLIYITPSNQFPLGVRMSLPRRLALLAKARAQGALILEDDYDSEFLWQGREIAALAAHGDGSGCVYLGSASKTLLPGLRLGWMTLPEPLVAPARAIHRNFGMAANLHAQDALAALMQTGQYRAHLRRIAHIYSRNGQKLHEALRALDGVKTAPPSGGVQLCVGLRKRGYEIACQEALGRAGYRVGRLSALHVPSDPDDSTPPGSARQSHDPSSASEDEGLIIGFAALRADDPARIAEILRRVLGA
ncbi:MocR-like pyridoxine biosynthesis transcription factor PdxR [Swaminathania salitolerans]|uniref:GntR family transcriptional regulator n=1 Tax=Swaminathania salitolerans TaxID=182838 RepID=A0A511BM41_9PROT|nr:PLP-dependent aminotransferase family protein [Swaminathania salitolerans]GBQ10536.1 MocR family transcriptional regulator [Swaminathania salitolerans LMG 21291]GEL01325.1 GntR family transcriptional regulator [Swaminathania salitolerans]